jgi:hypothetical protein
MKPKVTGLAKRAGYEWKLVRERKLDPEKQYLDIEIALSNDGIGHVYSKGMKCDFPVGSEIPQGVSRLVSEWLSLMECDFDIPKPTAVRNWIGNTICEATAMDPRNDGRASS